MEHLERLRFSNFGKLKTKYSNTPYGKTFKPLMEFFQSQYLINGRPKRLKKRCKLYR